MGAAALAQSFPDRPVKVIVPFAPGGSLDVLARLVADRLSRTWSQPVVIENKPGANGIVGVDALMQSPARRLYGPVRDLTDLHCQQVSIPEPAV